MPTANDIRRHNRAFRPSIFGSRALLWMYLIEQNHLILLPTNGDTRDGGLRAVAAVDENASIETSTCRAATLPKDCDGNENFAFNVIDVKGGQLNASPAGFNGGASRASSTKMGALPPSANTALEGYSALDFIMLIFNSISAQSMGCSDICQDIEMSHTASAEQECDATALYSDQYFGAVGTCLYVDDVDGVSIHQSPFVTTYTRGGSNIAAPFECRSDFPITHRTAFEPYKLSADDKFIAGDLAKYLDADKENYFPHDTRTINHNYRTSTTPRRERKPLEALGKVRVKSWRRRWREAAAIRTSKTVDPFAAIRKNPFSSLLAPE